MRRASGLLAIAAAWEVTARLVGSPMLVPVSDVIPALYTLLVTGSLVGHSAVSLARIALGFALAAITGVSLGVLVYRDATIRAAVMPVVDAVRPVAALTLFPLIILALGLGLWSKVFVIFWTAWPACLLNTVQALNDVDGAVLEAARLDGADEGQVLVHVSLPLALPVILTGLRIGLSGGWISLVAAEMLGAQSGLGWAVMTYSNTFRFAEMYAVIFTIAILGLAMNLGMARIQSISDLQGEGEYESRFLRFGNRSVGWLTDSMRWPATRRAG